MAHLEREARVGGYRAAWEVEAELEKVYARAARLVGGAPQEIALTDSATRS